MWLISIPLPCCHVDQLVTGVPLHVTVATWSSHQSGTQPTRTQTCNSRAWICIWFHNTNTIWILQLRCVKSFHVGQNPCFIEGGRIPDLLNSVFSRRSHNHSLAKHHYGFPKGYSTFGNIIGFTRIFCISQIMDYITKWTRSTFGH